MNLDPLKSLTHRWSSHLTNFGQRFLLNGLHAAWTDQWFRWLRWLRCDTRRDHTGSWCSRLTRYSIIFRYFIVFWLCFTHYGLLRCIRTNQHVASTAMIERAIRYQCDRLRLVQIVVYICSGNRLMALLAAIRAAKHKCRRINSDLMALENCRCGAHCGTAIDRVLLRHRCRIFIVHEEWIQALAAHLRCRNAKRHRGAICVVLCCQPVSLYRDSPDCRRMNGGPCKSTEITWNRWPWEFGWAGQRIERIVGVDMNAFIVGWCDNRRCRQLELRLIIIISDNCTSRRCPSLWGRWRCSCPLSWRYRRRHTRITGKMITTKIQSLKSTVSIPNPFTYPCNGLNMHSPAVCEALNEREIGAFLLRDNDKCTKSRLCHWPMSQCGHWSWLTVRSMGWLHTIVAVHGSQGTTHDCASLWWHLSTSVAWS